VLVGQPYPEWPPTGLHFNHSLWSTKTDENAMYDPAEPDCLSSVCRWWVAGMLKHASALMALCCPTVNCYRRLGGCFAPTFVDWSIDDRNATIRLKNNGPKVRRRAYLLWRDAMRVRGIIYGMSVHLSITSMRNTFRSIITKITVLLPPFRKQMVYPPPSCPTE